MTEEPTTTEESGFPISVHGSVLAEAVALVEGYVQPSVIELEEPGTGIKALALIGKDGLDAVPGHIFDDSRDTPRFREGTATLLDLDSFIEHTKRFKDDDPIVFADNNRTSPSLNSVLDYHRDRAGGDADARFMRHQAKFKFPLSDEWKAWTANNGKPMKMIDFAAFLEDRIIDVLPVGGLELNDDQRRFVETLGGTVRIADPAKLMELSKGLQIFENNEIGSAVKLASGESNMVFKSTHTDSQGGEVKVPSLFVLGIPVFVNGDAYQVLVRLRYRSMSGTVMFFYELWRTDRVFDHAFKEAVARVEEETGLPVLLGSPEA
jgi:uncharacterized protein YfdQ (DUF2303 family)